MSERIASGFLPYQAIATRLPVADRTPEFIRLRSSAATEESRTNRSIGDLGDNADRVREIRVIGNYGPKRGARFPCPISRREELPKRPVSPTEYGGKL